VAPTPGSVPGFLEELAARAGLGGLARLQVACRRLENDTADPRLELAHEQRIPIACGGKSQRDVASLQAEESVDAPAIWQLKIVTENAEPRRAV
jgi:hypothetical protein